jgi:hypothetical protein
MDVATICGARQTAIQPLFDDHHGKDATNLLAALSITGRVLSFVFLKNKKKDLRSRRIEPRSQASIRCLCHFFHLPVFPTPNFVLREHFTISMIEPAC